MKFYKLETRNIFFFDGVGIGHQFGISGWERTVHRLVRVDVHENILEEGPVDSYDQATFAKFGDHWYVAVTEFNEGAPQAETVFQLNYGIPFNPRRKTNDAM